ncbi:hypothetical protein CTA2_9631 [Colletotrichum tanaceti]|uniref:Alcohol dehydrogenase-like N-terminal domain-containing protein n=1 Tax=Colletotrichum tanaceti TaxID=1306861 RepID=A0A4U6XD29_9PEZI|nr:hypothetical protein CTA2_9631 [Colletotrichum tanaceti]TKW53243.1 hypothetical protein CTA1_6087 [Colletotrichum tanaceti]
MAPRVSAKRIARYCQTDAIVRITTADICGSDLHTHPGLSGGGAVFFTMGHEAIGYVAEAESAVAKVFIHLP